MVHNQTNHGTAIAVCVSSCEEHKFRLTEFIKDIEKATTDSLDRMVMAYRAGRLTIHGGVKDA